MASDASHHGASGPKSLLTRAREMSLPLILGVFVALAAANLAPDVYHGIVHWKLFGDFAIFGHKVDFHFLINDIFMVFFFGVAAKEITQATLPGGSLNPFRKALNPLFATVGGVAGPVLFFFAVLHMLYGSGTFGTNAEGQLYPLAQVSRGWGIPTATDIALAWLVARAVFGAGHPAINFLLLLAVVDDAIGLVIIAIFYGDPLHPAHPTWLLLALGGMAVAYGLRRMSVRSWVPYIALGGPLAWSGLLLANMHPALALVFIVPFLPGPKPAGIGEPIGAAPAPAGHGSHGSPLDDFEHQLKAFVDYGLFFFAFANAGVEFASMGPMTWLILGSLVIGKTIGIGGLALLGAKIGLPLPTGMRVRDAIMAGFVAALGLTVALFVATAAFVDPTLQGQAKMGALFSGFVGIVAVPIARAMGIRPGGK